jgi:predicted RNA binding protein YcfA (HicA-like mRNA interferase family)
MSEFPSVRATEFVRVIERLGFRLDRQRGSHVIFTHPVTMKRVVVAMHSGKDLKKNTLAGMLKDVGLERDEFLSLLKGS